MRLAIMQPYVFPYLGYYQLLHAADRFVLFDDVNFIKKGWINRNRILLNGEPHTFTIPVRDMSQNRTIKDHAISDEEGWRTKLLANLTHAYSKAPMFGEVFPVLERMFTEAEGSIASLAERSIRYVAERAGLTASIHRASDLALDQALKAQERILALCAHHGAERYINPANGAELYDEARFARSGIELRFLRMDNDLSYPQVGSKAHVPALSAIDALMHRTPEEIAALLARYRILTASELAAAHPTAEA
jgi:WbqC-like protein family